MNTTKIKIEGMHCDGCAQRVSRVLGREPGVKKVDVSFTECEARVQYDGQAITTDRLRELVERAGYTAQVAA